MVPGIAIDVFGPLSKISAHPVDSLAHGRAIRREPPSASSVWTANVAPHGWAGIIRLSRLRLRLYGRVGRTTAQIRWQADLDHRPLPVRVLPWEPGVPITLGMLIHEPLRFALGLFVGHRQTVL